MNHSQLLHQYQKSQLPKIAINTQDGTVLLLSGSILKLEASGGYTQIHIEDNSLLTTSKNLGYYQDMLEGLPFCRIHNKFIINLLHIIKIENGKTGRVILKDGSKVPISYRRRASFEYQVEEYLNGLII